MWCCWWLMSKLQSEGSVPALAVISAAFHEKESRK
jgi:hypothetical protein